MTNSTLAELAFYECEVGTILLDASQNVILWNRWIEKATGIESTQATGKPLPEIFSEQQLSPRLLRSIDKAIDLGHSALLSQKLHKHPFPFYKNALDMENEERMLQMVYIKPLDIENGARHCLIQIFDVTETANREAALKELAREAQASAEQLRTREEELRSIFESTSDCVLTLDSSGQIQQFNTHCCRFFKFRSNKFSKKNINELLVELRKNRTEEESMSDLHSWSRRHEPVELTAIDSEGVPTQVDVSVSSLGTSDYVLVIRDITERKKAEAMLEQLAQYDSLTGLANRALLQDRLNHAINRSHRKIEKLAILFLDLDRFKVINDSLGHSIGDQLLQAVAKRLSYCVRKTDTVARLGGDEFVIILENIGTEVSANAIAEKITSSLKEPFNIGRHELYITGSIGIAIYPDSGVDADTLIRNADTAMYKVKDEGRNGFITYISDMNQKAQYLLELDADLRYALKKQQFSLYFQPLLDLEQKRIAGAEALIRWKHPIKGFISPADFIPVAEDSGIIWDLGDWVLGEACRFAKSMQRQLDGFTVAVNISPHQFKNPTLLDTVLKHVADHKIEPYNLDLELTEGLLMEQTEDTIRLLNNFSDRGFKISIDDFGTGYSSLAYLRKFSLDTLKIDQSFVADLPDDLDAMSISNAIIQLAHSLRLKVIAEGVETPEQLAFLKGKGCEYLQGYHIAKPMPAEEFYAWLKDFSAEGFIQSS